MIGRSAGKGCGRADNTTIFLHNVLDASGGTVNGTCVADCRSAFSFGVDYLDGGNAKEKKMDEKREQYRKMILRTTEFQTREDGEGPIIEGYFAVFNSKYQMTSTMSESIAPGAFSSSMGNDVRALINHNTDLVLGRTSAHTLELKQDDHGLWGKIRINPNDTDAMNLYERVKRGDVNECSFGFNIVSQRTDISEDGSVHWTIEDLDLWEVSACTFPAYESTNISAREKDYNDIVKRQTDAWKEQMKERLNKWH